MPDRRAWRVSLVGAGPGDPGLLTMKGAQRIGEADVVLYDQLVSAPIVALANPSAEVVHRRDVGDQEALNQFLIDRARAGQRVVRLKGGDPFVFGRGGEEAEALTREGIPFEVVPGVTAGVAVPAYAGIPLTHRRIASDVTFVTGHEDPTKPDTAIDWERIVRLGGTLVIFMGVRRLPRVVERLVAAGADPQTPVAAVEWGTTPMQRTVEAPLIEIVDTMARHNLDHPSLIIVGEVVNLRKELNWFEKRSLWGHRVLVTRAAEQAAPLVDALREVGAGVIGMPVLEFAPPSSTGGLDAALDDLTKGDAYDWVLFTSANAVRFFTEAMDQRGLDLRSFAGAKVACIGPATAEALLARGIRADVVPEEYRAEGLLTAMGDRVRGQRILLPRAERGREILPDTLRERGGIVDVIAVYRTIRPRRSVESSVMHVTPADVIIFTSPSSVRNLVDSLGDEGPALLGARTLAAIGPICATALEEAGLTAHIVARTSTVEGLVDAIVEHFRP